MDNDEKSYTINKDEEIERRAAKYKRKLQCLRHIMWVRKIKVFQLVIEGKIVGRRRHLLLKNLRDWDACFNNQLFKSVVSKIEIVNCVHSLKF